MMDSKLDTYYNSLLTSYQNSYDDYIEEAVSTREEIKKLKPTNPEEYKAYPRLTDGAFNKKITAKKEFARHRYLPLSDKPRSFEDHVSEKCSTVSFNLTPNQKLLKNFLSPLTPYNSLLLYHGVGVGKCHAKDTPIIMYDGTTKLVQDIVEGDSLMGDDDKPRYVVSLARGQDIMYEIRPAKGSDIFVVNSEHILCLLDPTTKTIHEMTVLDYITSMNKYPHLKLYRGRIDNFHAHQRYCISSDPYTVGCVIPDSYLYNSRSIRLAVLAGIIDRCYGDFQNTIIVPIYCVQRIMFLIRSLGLGCHVDEDIQDMIHIFGENVQEVPTMIKHLKKTSDSGWYTDFMVTELGNGDYYGFVIDGNHRYLMGDFTVTHNTCTAISIAEQYLTEPDNKKVLVLLSSNIKDNFKKQIFDITRYNIETNESSLCTGTKYPDMILEKTTISKDTLDKRIGKLIKDRYQFMGYKELVEYTKKLMDHIKQYEKDPSKHDLRYKEKIQELFSDRLIIVDEAHNLRMPAENGSKQVSNTLMSILETAQNTKLLMLSATPMFNHAKEIIYMLKLLTINDKRTLPKITGLFDKDGDLSLEGEKTLMKASRGYISYMRGENPFSFPFRLYPSINKDKKVITKWPSKDSKGSKISKEDMIKYLELIGSDMSVLQKKIYNQIKEGIELDAEDEEDENIDDDATNDLQNTIQLCNITYPNPKASGVKGYYGKNGFEACFDRQKGKEFKYRKDILQNHGEILAYDKIAEYSPKIKSILDYIISSDGIVFVYSQYYYAGIYPLAIALEHIGFKKYNSTKNICKDMKDITNKFPGSKKTPSYIIISRDKDFSPNNDREIADAKARANMNGDEIKVVIVSKVGTEGIDFKNIREIHIMEPWFNLNRTEQIVGRGVRTCSHVDLPIEKRNVTIYMHAVCYSPTEESIDIKTYRIAEKKQRVISHVQKVLKSNSFDCVLNKSALLFPSKHLNMKTNILTSQGKTIKSYDIGDRDKSYICDFDECNLTCASEADKKELDDTTFDPMFMTDDIELYKRYVSQLFKTQIEMTYSDIYRALQETYISEIEEDVLAFALQEMVDNKYKFKDHIGNLGYLMYKGDLYVFQNSSLFETKLSLEERKDMKKVFKLDFDVLKVTKKPSKPEPSVNEKPTNENKDIIDLSHISKRYDELSKIVKQLPKPHLIKQGHIIECLVDRLTPGEIADIISKDHADKSVLHNLRVEIETLDIILNTGKQRYIIDTYNDAVFSVLDKGQIKLTGPLELAKIAKELKDAKTKIAKKNSSTGFVGLIDYSKRNEAQFKIRDNPKTKGFVCHQTSSLSVQDLKAKIVDAGQPLSEDGKYIKKHLCDIYELALRANGRFRRSIYSTKN